MSQLFSRWRRPGLALLLVAAAFSETARTSPVQPPDLRSMASALVGRWSGDGLYDGNRLGLTRRWSLDLGDSVARVEMAVAMPNGVSFRSLAYWRLGGDGPHDVLWMDELGRFEMLQAEVDAATRDVSIEFVDAHAEGGPAPRRWVYRMADENHYVEQLYGPADENWKLLAEFSLRRQD